MKIGINCYLLKKDIGGARQYLHTLLQRLSSNDTENEYVLFYFDRNIDAFKDLGLTNRNKYLIFLKNQNDIRAHVKKLDIYFCPFGVLWPRPLKIPCVVTLHDIQETFFPHFFSKHERLSRAYHYSASLSIADSVITVSEFSKNAICKHHNIPASKVFVAHNSVNAFFTHPPDPEFKLNETLPDQFIFYPANKWRHKNHDNLLKALLHIKQKYNIRIHCVLTGYNYKNGYNIKETVDAYKLHDQIYDLEYVSIEAIRYLYHNAEMLCFPSLFEGFGMPVIEAMAAGCPVSCSNTTTLPEVAGDAAVFFNPKDPEDIAKAILDVWQNKQLKARLISSGKKNTERFHTKQMIDSHMTAFRHAIRNKTSDNYYYHRYIYEPIKRLTYISKSGICAAVR